MGDLLVEMRLVDQETIRAALVEQRVSGRRLPRILAEKRVLDEERLTKAVATKLGLEAVNVSSLKIHERVLALIPVNVAAKYGVLPIAIKRVNQAEVLYLVMADPLDTEAIGEVQRLTGRQVRVLMATSSDVDQAISTQYKAQLRSPATPPPLRPPAKRAKPPTGPKAQGGAKPQSGAHPAVKTKSGEMPKVVRSPLTRTTSGMVVVGPPPGPPSKPQQPPPISQSAASEKTAQVPRAERAQPSVARAPAPRAPAVPPKPNIARTSSPNLSSPRPQAAQARTPAPESEGLVYPSELDPPDSQDMQTRVDPDHAARVAQLQSQASAGADPAWELAVRDWEQPNEAWSQTPEASEGASSPKSAASKPATRAPAPAAEATEARPSAATQKSSAAESLEGEEIETGQLDLRKVSASELEKLRSVPTAAPEPEAPLRPLPVAFEPSTAGRVFAGTLEVPVEAEDRLSPFDGSSQNRLPVGLEPTGIIPTIDWGREGFHPPQPDTPSPSRAPSEQFLGASDIPLSAEAAEARRLKEPAPGLVVPTAAKETSGGSLGPEAALRGSASIFQAPDAKRKQAAATRIGPPARAPEPVTRVAPPTKAAPLSKPEDSDADSMPVIEPSSLVSLMDEASDSAEPTGADPSPIQEAVPEPKIHVLDEVEPKRADAPIPPQPSAQRSTPESGASVPQRNDTILSPPKTETPKDGNPEVDSDQARTTDPAIVEHLQLSAPEPIVADPQGSTQASAGPSPAKPAEREAEETKQVEGEEPLPAAKESPPPTAPLRLVEPREPAPEPIEEPAEAPTNPRMDGEHIQALLNQNSRAKPIVQTLAEVAKPARPAPDSDSSESADRASVLSALDGAFEPFPEEGTELVESKPEEKPPVVPPKAAPPKAGPPKAVPPKAGPPKLVPSKKAETPPQPRAPERKPERKPDRAQAMVQSMIEGETLSSAERTQLMLALGRLLIQKGLIDADELAELLRD